jgi:hypothetical protein
VSAAPPSLSVEGLRIEARLAQGTRTIVRSLDLDVSPGETVSETSSRIGTALRGVS